MKEEKYTCDICHEEHDVSELTYFDESYLCEDCLRRETFICRDCGDRHWNDDSADGDLCQTCYDEDYVRCERCDAVIHYDDACYHEDEEYHDHPYCRECFDMDEIIHDYYYKPEPIFYGDGPRYLGVELELDDGGENEFCASKLLDIANAQKAGMYISGYHFAHYNSVASAIAEADYAGKLAQADGLPEGAVLATDVESSEQSSACVRI